MSNIYDAFVNVIEQQPELFATEDRQDLAEKSSTWSNEPEKLDNKIGQWLRARPNIRTAALKSLSFKDSDKLPGNGTKAPAIKPEDYKPMLLNAIHRSFNPTPQTATTSK
jgi:hypothetical protein